ncbi:disulfide bond formation protein B [Xanthobacter autotrophicus]|uniref:disulfide bond formation protein B n=1 Tax=Xanthobacter autotrophicus TaxID=280 RepID=UPI0024A6D6E0|nr:disulfide bond formation protein B [Xanthobacter autotrophicus]MDI4657356.1 disulfide bond formation protein B [Xanthobacter autotrophicus]
MLQRLDETAALLLVTGSALALAAAWYFQLVVGLAPCPLCLDQRLPYYAAIPLGLLAFAAARSGRITLARALLGVIGLAMVGNMGLAIFHAGVEWQFWSGPTACTGAPVMTGNVLSALKGARVPRCDEAAWRLLGISMAGWNALIAAGLAVVAFGGATTGRKA